MDNLTKIYRQAEGKREFAAGYFAYLSQLLAQVDPGVVAQIIEAFEAAGRDSRAIYFVGNGGSASTASHFAADLALNTLSADHPKLKAFSLSDNVAALTALANDGGYEDVFFRHLEGMIQAGDVLVALSVSGNSPNVVNAARYARQMGATVIGCTGFDGGELKKLSHLSLHVPTPRGEYGPVEDIFQILDHLVYTYLRLARLGKLER